MAMDMAKGKKSKLANMKMPADHGDSEMPGMDDMSDLEEEAPEGEHPSEMDLEAEMGKPMQKDQKGADALAVASDEELMAELKKRGLSGGGDMGPEMEQVSY